MSVVIFGHGGRIGQCVSHILGQDNYIGVELGEARPVNLQPAGVVLSCCPFTANLEVARWARENGQNYADLGGDPETSAAIKELYKDSDLSCITDLGLAPGLINILTEWQIKKFKNPPTNVEMFCGGLPYDNNLPNSLKYALTWSEKGLYNEYVGNCDILLDGQIRQVPALTMNPCLLNIDNIRYEAATTKGGIADSLSRFQALGVKNAAYFTLRYLGHYQYLYFLLNECKLTQDEFVDIIQRVCPRTNEDIVVVRIDLDDKVFGIQFKYSDKFTAMQIATALPTAIVVNLIHQGQRINNYGDIDMDRFMVDMNNIVINLFPGLVSSNIVLEY